MKRRNKNGVFAAIRMAARAHHVLTAGTILCVAASVVASLLPPLLLARIIDGLTQDDYIAFPYGKNVKDGAKTEMDENGDTKENPGMYW